MLWFRCIHLNTVAILTYLPLYILNTLDARDKLIVIRFLWHSSRW